MNGILVLAAVTISTALFVHSWTAAGARLDRDLPTLLDDPISLVTACDVEGHIWHRYSNYRFCGECGLKEYQS